MDFILKLTLMDFILKLTLEFGWVKYWQMTFVLSNSPKFFPRQNFVLQRIWYIHIATPLEVKHLGKSWWCRTR